MKTLTESPEKNTHFLSLKNPTFVHDSGSVERRRRSDLKITRRKFRNLGFPSSGIRFKKDFSLGGKTSGLATPLLKWKFDPQEDHDDDKTVQFGKEVRVSARKLAAGLWNLHQLGIIEDRNLEQKKLGFEADVGTPFFSHCRSIEGCSNTKNLLETHFPISNSKNGNLCKVQPPCSFSNSAMERATKWDPGCSKTSDEVYKFYGQVKLLEDQQTAHISVVSTLQQELIEAQTRIHELEIERNSSKKQVEHFLRNLKEEKTTWRIREHEKVRAIIDDIKDDFNTEKKNRQRLELVNLKLVDELTKTKKSMKQLMQDYEKERKNRELMEEVCDELAKEIGEDKAEVEVLKRDSMKMRAEVEEEKKMLQMAEVWREERVQMKLIDAKLVLEKKYNQLNKLITDLDTFIRSRTGTMDSAETKEARMLREAANSVNIQDIKLSYEPPNSEDIFSVLKDLRPNEPDERETDSCLDFDPDASGVKRNTADRYSNEFIDHNGEVEDDRSGWESVSHIEEQRSRYSAEGSELSINMSEVSNAGNETPNTHIRKKKGSSLSRLWRLKPSATEKFNIVSNKGRNERLSNGRMFNEGDICSPDRRSYDSSQSIVSQSSLSRLGNRQSNEGNKWFKDRQQGAQEKL